MGRGREREGRRPDELTDDCLSLRQREKDEGNKKDQERMRDFIVAKEVAAVGELYKTTVYN